MRVQPQQRPRRHWTIQRATGMGVVAGMSALLLRVLYAGWPELLRLPFLTACILAAFCGLSILWITAVDRYRRGRRGSRMVPLRTFDVALALLLAVPSLAMVPALLAEF